MNLRMIFLPAVALLFAACRHDVKPEYTRIQVDTLLVRGAWSIDAAYDFLSIANASRSASLEAIERANIDYFFELEQFEGTAREAAEAALNDLAANNLPAPGDPLEDYERECWVSVASEAERCDSMLVYSIHAESYLGGAHGMNNTYYHVYSLSGGYELSLEDLFDAPMRERLRAALVERLYAENGVEDHAGLSACGFFPDEIDLTENFAPTADGGLLFYYNPYDIACYARGPVEVLFSRRELKALAER